MRNGILAGVAAIAVALGIGVVIAASDNPVESPEMNVTQYSAPATPSSEPVGGTPPETFNQEGRASTESAPGRDSWNGSFEVEEPVDAAPETETVPGDTPPSSSNPM